MPSHIMELMNFSASVELYTGSGRISRGSGLRLRGIRYFAGPFGRLAPYFDRPCLRSAHAGRIQRPAHHVIAHARQILHAAAADQHDGVFLQIVADAGNVSGHFDPVGQPHARHLPQRRIGLLGRGGVHARTHAALLRAGLQRRTGGLIPWRSPPFSHELIERRHESPLKTLFGSLEHNGRRKATPLKKPNRLLSCEGTYCGLAHILKGSNSLQNIGADPRTGSLIKTTVPGSRRHNSLNLYKNTGRFNACQIQDGRPIAEF